MREKLTPLLLAVGEHGGTELALKYNDFFTDTFRARVQVTGQVGIRQSHGQSHKGRKSFSCLKKSQSRQQNYRITDKWDTMLRQEGSHE